MADWQTAEAWSNNFKTSHVDPRIFKNGQDFVSAESVVLCARRWTSADAESPDMAERSGTGSIADYIAIGLVQNVNISQNKQIQQLFEIGSKLPYFVPGRTLIQVSMGRIILNGDSLLKMFYPGTDNDSKPSQEVNDLLGNYNGSRAGATYLQDGDDINGTAVKTTSGFYINLAADLFNIPLDLLVFAADSENEIATAFVLKQCYVQSHQMGLSAQQVVVAENVSLRCAQILPMSTT